MTTSRTVGVRGLSRGLIITLTLFTAVALRAAHTEDKAASKFIETAAQANLAEIQLGELGTQKGQHSAVKDFAKDMRYDHQKANEELKRIAQQLGVQWPAAMGEQHEQALQKLRGLSGEEFDREFALHSLREHAKARKEFEKASRDIQQEQVQTYVEKYLRTLEEHLEHSEDLAKRFGVDQKTIAAIIEEREEVFGAASDKAGQAATEFIQKAAQVNLAEIELGKLGAKQGHHSSVKDFAENMRYDHQKGYDDLKPIAQQLGITLAEAKDRRHEQALQKLRGLSGEEFDQEFLTHTLREHVKTAKEFEQASREIQQERVKAYADKILSDIDDHLEHAERLAKRLGVDQKTITTILQEREEAFGAPVREDEEPEREQKPWGRNPFRR
jgi:putative membrane protein